MVLSKRDIARIERSLVAALTDACETAKAEIPGFEWLTHTVDYADLPRSLRITWVFDTRASKDRALLVGADKRMHALTLAALSECKIIPLRPEHCIRFDSQEECNQQHRGDWRMRLS